MAKYLTKAIRCPDGKRKYIRAKTKEGLEEKVRIAMAQIGQGININDSTTFRDFAQTWVNVYKRPNISPASADVLVSRINTHILPRLGPMRVRDIRSVHIAEVMSDMSKSSRATQSAVLSTMRAIFRCAIENNIIARSPVSDTTRPGGQSAIDREPLSPEQCQALLNAAKGHSDDLYMFVLLALYTGMRKSEILGLCWDCVDFEKSMIYVRRQVVTRSGKKMELTETLKTKGSRRDIPAPFGLCEILAIRKQKVGGDRVFPVSDEFRADLVWHKLNSLSGVRSKSEDHTYTYSVPPLDFHCHPHLLRHTYATRLFEAGLDIKEVQYLLGHSTPGMTLRVYTHYDRKSRQMDTAKKISSALPMPGIAL